MISLTVLSGLWAKDSAASQLAEYERALDLWRISGPQRATARLIEVSGKCKLWLGWRFWLSCAVAMPIELLLGHLWQGGG